jgi:hypothetical protein
MSTKHFLVASGFPQYPMKTLGPLNTNFACFPNGKKLGAFRLNYARYDTRHWYTEGTDFHPAVGIENATEVVSVIPQPSWIFAPVRFPSL